MCMQPTSYQSQQNVPMESVREAQALKPSVLQTTTSVVAILSIVAYLGQRGCEGAATEESSRQSWFPHIVLLAFLFNMLITLFSSEKAQDLMNGWRKNAQPGGNLMKSIASASSSEALSRLARVSSTNTFRRISKSICDSIHRYNHRRALQALTRKECFAKLNFIEQLSVDDIIVLFRYTTELNQPDFNRDRFISEQNQLVRAMVTAMDLAVSISRGSRAKQIKLAGTRNTGDVDALYFVAATRIFNEWRSLRNVPKGYKRYSVAIGLGYRDILQNLVKIEMGVHSYLKDTTRQDGNENPIPSPTLRQLLEYERHVGVHPRLPKLADKSAATGLLWTKRQVEYHTTTQANVLEVPSRFATTRDAGEAAYKEVYDDYHGWAVKKVFCHSLGGSPPAEKLWEVMEPPARPEEPSSNEKANYIPRKLSDVSDESVEEEPVVELFIEVERLGMHIVERWEDILRYFRCVATERQSHQSNNLLIPSENYEIMKRKLDKASLRVLDASLRIPTKAPAEETKRSDPADSIQKVRAGAANFVKELRPLLKDLGDMLDELNMNDPTVV